MNSSSKPSNFPRIAVLASGSGTNFQAIIDDAIPVKLLVTDRNDAKAIERAEKASIEYAVVPRSQFKKRREEFTNEVLKHLELHKIDLLVFAGFMTILSPALVEKYENRALNIHPSLLPAFRGTYGRNTMTATLEAGVKVTGVTVHIATQEVDAGPILAQESIEVLESDDEDSLHERIQKVEHRIYPQTIRQFCAECFVQNNERH